MSKKLVVFFSATGATARVAEVIAAAVEADICEIKPEEAYTADDLNWNNPESRSSVEMKDPASRVAIAGAPVDMTAYDKIYVGYPIWWGVAPHIINTFLEAHDLTGKTVVPFATSAGSEIGDVAAYLGASVKGATIEDCKRFSAVTEKAEIEEWVK